MLHSLKYAVEFPSTGRTFANQLDFEPGLTAIVGENEAGKSLVVEMIGYCFFGKAALRGLATDYKNLSAELTATIKGKAFAVSRKPKREILTLDGEEVAIGAEAINKYVPAFLGYGLDVHNIALVALQDDLAAMTAMKPTARRAMIDQLTGMGSIEATEKECKDAAKQANKEAEYGLSLLTKPIKPVAPENYYKPTQFLRVDLSEAESIQQERNQLLRVAQPEEPVEPPVMVNTVSGLEMHQQHRQDMLMRYQSLTSQLSMISEPEFDAEELAKAVAARDNRDAIRLRGPKPEYTIDDLKRWTFTEKCPECGYEVEDAPITPTECVEQLQRHNNWAQPLEEITYEGPIKDVKREERAHAQLGQSSSLRRALERLSIPADRSADLDTARTLERLWDRYNIHKENYDKLSKHYMEAQERLAQLPDQAGLIQTLRDTLSEAQTYERAIVEYDRASEAYEAALLKIAVKQGEVEGYDNGIKALRDTRMRVKQELVPSLSKVASALLYSLTAGVRQYVVIDQDFNVTVDGQPLQTLSGSGKAVVNLALRIGIGQVLTSKVLSLFIGDEIDGSMDKTRKDATHATFSSLTKHIEQVLLITHKDVDADHLIVLSAQ